MAAATPDANAPIARRVAGVLSSVGDFVEAIGDKIEDARERDGEQRKRDGAVELRDPQVGQNQRQQRRHDRGKSVKRGCAQAGGCGRAKAAGWRLRRWRASRGRRTSGSSTRSQAAAARPPAPVRAVAARAASFRPGHAAIAAKRHDACEWSGRGRRRSAPGGRGKNCHDDDREDRPLRIHARGPECQDGQRRQGGKCRAGNPVGLGGIVGCGKMRLDRHEGGGERKLNGDVNEQRRRPEVCAVSVNGPDQRQAPDHGARDRCGSQPQPTPQTRKRKCGPRDDCEIEDERPGIWLLGLDQQRHGERAGEPQASQCRAVQRGGEHGGDADRAKHEKGRGGPMNW